MTQLLLAIQAGLVFALPAIPQLPLSDNAKSVASFACGIGIAMLTVLLPKVSATIRRVMDLQRRG